MELPIDETDEALFAAATKVTVRNGIIAKFWTSSWLNGFAPAAMFPALYIHCKRKKRTVAAAIHNNNWIRDIMTNLTTNLVEEYVQLWMLVDAFQFNPNEPGEDQIVWMRTADGHYSAASAYQI